MRISKIAGLAALLTLTAFAAPITMTHSGVGTGTVGATGFTSAPFILTELLDTANRQAFGAGEFVICFHMKEMPYA